MSLSTLNLQVFWVFFFIIIFPLLKTEWEIRLDCRCYNNAQLVLRIILGGEGVSPLDWEIPVKNGQNKPSKIWHPSKCNTSKRPFFLRASRRTAPAVCLSLCVCLPLPLPLFFLFFSSRSIKFKKKRKFPLNVLFLFLNFVRVKRCRWASRHIWLKVSSVEKNAGGWAGDII